MQARFELEIPGDLGAALSALGEGPDGTLPIAGGTNLVVDLRAGREAPGRLVALGRIAMLRGIAEKDGRIVLGAATTVSDLLHSPLLASVAPALVEAARQFAGQMVRNTATVAGNVACGSPAADLVPPLMSLDAELTLHDRDGERRVPLDGYYTGYKRDVRRPGELITSIDFPRPPQGAHNAFYKLARRKGDAITVTGVAVTVVRDGERCRHARIVLGAVAPVVMRARRAEALLAHGACDEACMEAAARAAAEECQPIDDVRASAAYRRQMVHVLVRRLLHAAWQRPN